MVGVRAVREALGVELLCARGEGLKTELVVPPTEEIESDRGSWSREPSVEMELSRLEVELKRSLVDVEGFSPRSHFSREKRKRKREKVK